MKFLIDAQLPRRLVQWLHAAGFEAIHTLDLPLGNRTPDTEINALSVREQYVVVTKDADFVTSFHLQNQPYKLLLVSTGQHQEFRTRNAVSGECSNNLTRVPVV